MLIAVEKLYCVIYYNLRHTFIPMPKQHHSFHLHILPTVQARSQTFVVIHLGHIHRVILHSLISRNNATKTVICKQS